MNDEWHRLQLEQSAETFRFIIGLALGTWSFLIAADAALLVYGFSSGSAIALVAAGCTPAACLLAWLGCNRTLVPIAYVGLRNERALAPAVRSGGIVHTVWRTCFPQVYGQLEHLASLDDEEEAQRQLFSLVREIYIGRRIIWGLGALTLAQLGITVWYWFR